RLHAEPVLDDAAVRHMGLAVVRRISARHELHTNLERRSPHGTTATVLLPAHVMCELDENTWSGKHTVVLPRTGLAPATDPDPGVTGSPDPGVTGSPGQGGNGAGGAPQQPTPVRQPHLRPAAEQSAGGTTQNGLPRRVSRSIRNADVGPQDAMETADSA